MIRSVSLAVLAAGAIWFEIADNSPLHGTARAMAGRGINILCRAPLNWN
jgi:hypothetical protein